MSLTLQRTLATAAGHPVRAELARRSRDPAESTLAALRKAGTLANHLGAHITLLVPQVVPYPLSLESPPVLIDWNERRFRVISEESVVKTTVHVYFCRDHVATLLSALSPGSMVVIGGRKRWWPTPETRLAHKLRNAAHEVILVEIE